jgi:hypothetical protein
VSCSLSSYLPAGEILQTRKFDNFGCNFPFVFCFLVLGIYAWRVGGIAAAEGFTPLNDQTEPL